MYLYLEVFSFIAIFLHASSIKAANTYSNGQNFPLPIRIYPTQERQTSTLLLQQHQPQQQQYIPYRPLQRNNNGYDSQNSYSYQTLLDQYNYNNVRPTGISFTQSQSQLSTEQLHRQQQLERFPFLINRPISANSPSLRYDPGYQYLRANEYQRANFKYSPQNHDENYNGRKQISLPSSRESTLVFDQNSVVSFQSNRLSTPVDYTMHFERYLRKYPERLQPTYNNIDYGK